MTKPLEGHLGCRRRRKTLGLILSNFDSLRRSFRPGADQLSRAEPLKRTRRVPRIRFHKYKRKRAKPNKNTYQINLCSPTTQAGLMEVGRTRKIISLAVNNSSISFRPRPTGPATVKPACQFDSVGASCRFCLVLYAVQVQLPPGFYIETLFTCLTQPSDLRLPGEEEEEEDVGSITPRGPTT